MYSVLERGSGQIAKKILTSQLKNNSIQTISLKNTSVNQVKQVLHQKTGTTTSKHIATMLIYK